MSSNNFVIVEKYTESTKYLIPLIFNKNALSILQQFGFQNVYLNDYGHNKRYEGCLFFLFNTTKDKSDYDKFERKIANFNSFYDYYEIHTPNGEKKMYIFKVHDAYKRDLFCFNNNRLNELSKDFYEISPEGLDLSKKKINVTKEIYRYNLYLEKEKGDI